MASQRTKRQVFHPGVRLQKAAVGSLGNVQRTVNNNKYKANENKTVRPARPNG